MENSNDDIRVFLSSPQSLELIEKIKIKPKIKFKRKKRKIVSKKLLIKNILMEEDLSKLTERQKILNKKFRDNVKELDDISLINSGIDIIPYNINNVTVLGRFMEEEECKGDDKDSLKKRKLIKEERLGSIYYKKLYEDCLNRVKPVNKRLCKIKLKNMSNIYKIQIPLGDRNREDDNGEGCKNGVGDDNGEVEEDGLSEDFNGDGMVYCLSQEDCNENNDNEVNLEDHVDIPPFTFTKEYDFKVPVSIEVIKDFTKITLKISKTPFLTISNHILRIPIDHPPPLINYPITLYPKNHIPFLQNFLLYKKEKEIYAKKCLFLSCLCKNMENFSLKYEEDINDQPSSTATQPTLSENKISCLMKIFMYLELIQISLKIHKCEITGLLIEKLKIILERINNSKCVCDIEERIMNVLTKADQCKKCKYEK